MKVIRAPRTLLVSSAALFLLVPLAVVTAGVFSSHVWWDLPMGELMFAGWVTLAIVAPISWRLIMGRRGAWEVLAATLGLFCLVLLFRAAWIRGTLQALWAVLMSGVSTLLVAWTRHEQKKSYFDPELRWFQGWPVAIPRLAAVVLGDRPFPEKALRVCRLDEQGAFLFSVGAGQIPEKTEVELELRYEDSHQERKARITGTVVRQFECRASMSNPGDWGLGIQFHAQDPDAKKEFRDFIEVLRGEGYINV